MQNSGCDRWVWHIGMTVCTCRRSPEARDDVVSVALFDTSVHRITLLLAGDMGRQLLSPHPPDGVERLRACTPLSMPHEQAFCLVRSCFRVAEDARSSGVLLFSP